MIGVARNFPEISNHYGGQAIPSPRNAKFLTTSTPSQAMTILVFDSASVPYFFSVAQRRVSSSQCEKSLCRCLIPLPNKVGSFARASETEDYVKQLSCSTSISSQPFPHDLCMMQPSKAELHSIFPCWWSFRDVGSGTPPSCDTTPHFHKQNILRITNNELTYGPKEYSLRN